MAKGKKALAISLLVILGIVIIGVGAYKAAKKENKRGIFVKTVEVSKEDISSIIISDGTVKSKVNRNVVTTLPYKIKEILVKEGDKVSKGQVLAKLDTEDIEFNIRAAEINLEIEKQNLKNMLEGKDTFQLEKNLENAKLNYENAQKKYQNSVKLYEAGAISKSQLEADSSALATAKINFELAQKQLEDAKKAKDVEGQKKRIELQELNLKKQKEEISKSIIKSPIDGVIVYSGAKLGVPANTVSPLFIIDDTSKLEIEVNISEYDINDIKLGQEVKITGEAFKNREYKGKVSYISPVATEMNTGRGIETNVKIKIDILNPDEKIKPGFSADVSINTANKKDALVVPYEALYHKKDGSIVVFKVEEGKAVEIPVLMGVEGDLKAEIISKDLKEGDQIILNPTEKIKDGMEVSILKGDKK
ncbi:efflux RND transporter periplasmic adaptor subunit [Caloranaerobacter azorensis]|uniref:Efflux RND transporter periplasmic adaptor subunit n=1 Tax=Caloranaerobacter azorensis TaxID=116090 RepID=A0A6P1YFE7_9FIRM|nr:efflux RND transporter periplasmic adaptor subunit [Caloranaerobacter azorensis]QIB27468.1 efflux RND transporter periplasmic adaptor subunit [Caloranaerobacter azorensis]